MLNELERLEFEDITELFSSPEEKLYNEYMKGHNDGIDKVRETLASPSCFFCVHAVLFEDPSVGIPLHIEGCTHWRVPKWLFDAYIDQIEELDKLNNKKTIIETELPKSYCGSFELDFESLKLSW